MNHLGKGQALIISKHHFFYKTTKYSRRQQHSGRQLEWVHRKLLIKSGVAFNKISNIFKSFSLSICMKPFFPSDLADWHKLYLTQ